MYHRPRMCRTCLQMSRGDFKFVSLDAGDPLWESNSPNLKEQLLTLVPEMKLDGSGTVMCTSCFIALRTAYEFKKMCQYTEQRFQNYNYKYRRPFGVGPGSAQFHVTLNETRKSLNNKNGFYGCQNINFLQADTSIDITEHHLYDASKPPPRKDFLKDPLIDQVIKTPIESLPSSKVEDKEEVKPVEIKPVETKPITESKPIEVKPLIPEKPVELKPAVQIKLAEVIKEIKVPEIKRQQVARKKITASLHIRKKYKIGSEISILKSENRSVSKVDAVSENKNVSKLDLIIKRACDEIEYLKENCITPKSLSCYSKITKLSKPDNLEQLSKEANSYYFDALEAEVSCQHCSKTFDTKYKLNMHDIETHPDKQVFKCSECVQEFVHEINLKQHVDNDHTKPVISNLEEDEAPLEKVVEEATESMDADVEMIEPDEKLEDDPLIDVPSKVLEDSNDKFKDNKESNIELEKDALLVVSKVVEDKLLLDDGKKCKPSYEDDDEDFILEDNAFNISDSEDESIDIEINESEINQLLQDDYEGKIIKNITSKSSETNKKVKEEKVLTKSPYIMILPKPMGAESLKIDKSFSNFVAENQVDKLLSKKQIEEKVNKLAEIQFVEVKRILPNRHANTSTTEEKGLSKNTNTARESKELSKTNLNSKIEKEEVPKVAQKSRLDVSNSKDNVRKELPKLTLLTQVNEVVTKKEFSKASIEKVQKEAPKQAALTITKVEKEGSKNQAVVEKLERLSPKKPVDASTITSKQKESPKAKVNVQNEKNKAQKESPKKQDKPILEKGNKVKEVGEVKKDSPKNQEKSNLEKGNKQKEKQDKPIVEKGNKLKESSEVKTNVQSKSVEVKLAVQKETPKRQDEVKIEIRQESSKSQDESTLEDEIELLESVVMETDVLEQSSKVQDELASSQGNILQESDEVKMVIDKESPKKQDKSTPEKGNKVKDSPEVPAKVQKESRKNHDKSSPKEENKLKASTENENELSKKQDKSTPEKSSKLKEVQTEVQTESLRILDRSPLKRGSKLKESAEVEKELMKQNKSTPEKKNKVKEVQVEIPTESRTNPNRSPLKRGSKLKESAEVEKEMCKKQDKSTPEKRNKLKESPKVQAEVQRESPKHEDKSTPEKRNKLKESPKVQAEVQRESPKHEDKSTPEKRNKLKESPKVQAEVQRESPKHEDKSTPEKRNKLKESPKVQAEVQRESPKHEDKSTPEKRNKLKESPKVQAEVQRESPKHQDKSTPEKRNKLKESSSVKKELFKKQDKSTPEKKSKLKESPEVQGDVQKKSPRIQDKLTPEKGNKPKESATVKKELFKKQDKPSPKKENKLIESPVVQKVSPKKQDPITPEKESIIIELPEAKVLSIPEIQKDLSGSQEEIDKSEVEIDEHKEDISNLQTVNEEELSEVKTDTKAEVPAESPKKQNIAVVETVNDQKELPVVAIEVVEENLKQQDVTAIEPKESVEMEVVVQKESPEKSDMPILEKENVPVESPKIITNTQTEVQMESHKQDMPTLENVNKELLEEPKMHLDPPVLQNEINIKFPQVQLNPENKVGEMDVDIPVLEDETSIELPNVQSDIPEKLTEEKDIEGTYVKPYWYRYINYVKCLICQKLCRNKLQLLQHCKFVHVPTITAPPKIVEDEEVEVIEIIENTAATTDLEAIKLYKKDDTPYKCNICDKQVLAKEYLEIHMHIHIPYSFIYDNDRVDNFICYICNKTFPKDRFMKLHNLQVHQTKHTVCKICNRLFKSEFWYGRHKCLVPQNPSALVEEKQEVEDDAQINPHICNVCDRRFGRLRFLKSHQHRMHPEAYKINFGDGNANTSNTLLESQTEANSNVSLKDPKEDPKEEGADSKSAANIIDDEVKFLKSSESNYKRKSTDRMPKLQCDFCGTMICENLYDGHIYEHNKKRMQKARKSDEKLPDNSNNSGGPPETPTSVTPGVVASEEKATTETTPNPTPVPEKLFMKCDFCFRVFQRKYHLANHIKKHHGDVSQSADVQSGNEESEAAEEGEESETFRNESMEMLECCGRQFKLKAHYARHCSTKHPDKFYKSTPSKPASPIPTLDASAILSTRRSNTYKAKETDNENIPSTTEEPVKEKRVIKRKTLDLVESTESVKRVKVISNISLSTPESLKRKKSLESDGESARKKKVPPSPPPPPIEGDDQDTSLFKYQCSTCSRKFKQYNQLRDHNNVHTGDRPYKCFFCEPVRGFTQTSSLYVHFRRVHVSIVNNVEWEPYSKNGVCLICSSVFEKHSEMFQHAKEFYVDEGFKCDVCEQHYTMSCHHRVHSPMPIRHKAVETSSSNTIEPPTRCDPCDKVFATQHMFRLHKKSLAHIQQVQTLKKQSNRKKSDDSTTIEGLANSVGDILKTLSGMKKHKHYKHKCYACGKTFNKRVNLKIHRRQNHRKKSRDTNEDEEDEQKASSSADVPVLDENEILKSITAKRRPSVLSENSDDKIDNQTDLEELDDNVDQSSQSSCSQDDEFDNIKTPFDDSTEFDAMKLVESLQLPDDVIDEVIANEANSELLCSQMKSAVEEIAFNVGYPSSSDDFPQDIIESDGVTYTKMRGVPIDSLE